MVRFYFKMLSCNLIAVAIIIGLILMATQLGGCCYASTEQGTSQERIIGPKVSSGSLEDEIS